eukprot:881814_1
MIFRYGSQTLYEIHNSMVQGTKSGGDCCTFVCTVQELMRLPLIERVTRIFFRYKDDILFLSSAIIDKNDANTMLQNVYSNTKFSFEIDIHQGAAQICDIIVTNRNGILETSSANDTKIRSDIMKSSDVVQDIGAFSLLCSKDTLSFVIHLKNTRIANKVYVIIF